MKEKLSENRKRIASLEKDYRSKIEAEKKNLEELHALTENILAQIEWLTDQKRMYLSRLKEVMVPLKFESPTMIGIPSTWRATKLKVKLGITYFPHRNGPLHNND